MALLYSTRASLFGHEITYGVDEANLSESDGRVMPLRDIMRVRTYRVPGMRLTLGGQQVSAPFERCVITLRHGPHIALSSRHFLGFGRAEDRWSSYNPFVDTLVTEVRKLNPEAKFIAGMPMRLWLFWLVILVASLCLALAAVLMMIGLAVERQTDIDEWLTGFFILMGGLSGLSFYSVLKTGWPRDYDPLKVGEKS